MGAQIIKEVPVYIKVDPIEWEARHGLKAGVAVQSTAYYTRSPLCAPPAPLGGRLASLSPFLSVHQLQVPFPNNHIFNSAHLY